MAGRAPDSVQQASRGPTRTTVTTRLLAIAIAGVFGLVLIAMLLWCGPVLRRHAALEEAAPDLAALDRSDGLAASRDLAARTPSASEAASVDPPDGTRGDGEGASRGSAPLAERADPAFEIVRSTLAEAIGTHLPDLVLSGNELDDLARATLRLRSAQAELRRLPKTREHADQRRLERFRLEEAVADFTYLVEMTPAEFSRRVAPDSGVDAWTSGDTPLDVSIRPIRPIGVMEGPE